MLALLEAIDLVPPLSVFCSDVHMEMEGYTMEVGCTIEFPLLPPGLRSPARGISCCHTSQGSGAGCLAGAAAEAEIRQFP